MSYIGELLPLLIGALVFATVFVVKGLVGEIGAVESSGSITGIALSAGAMSVLAFRRFRPNVDEAILSPSILAGIAARIAAVFGGIYVLITAFGIAHKYNPTLIFASFIGAIAIVAMAMLVVGLYMRLLKAEGRALQRVAIYGRGDLMAKVAMSLMESGGTAVVGFYDDPPAGASDHKVPLKGGIDDLLGCARDQECDRIIVALPITDRERIERTMAALEVLPTDVFLCPESLPPPCQVQGAGKLGSLLLLNVQSHPLGARGMIVKSMLDYSLAAIAAVLLSPFMLAIAIAIKLDSKGPVLFVQSRGGCRNSIIRVFKFRTMNVLEDGPTVVQATRGDPRVTRVGRFLRRTSLDELPQLFNVLRGDLSLVGPRPHALAHDEYYAEIVQRYLARQRIKPGITGWAQVNGYRSATTDPEMMRKRVDHDLYYIENWSPLLDVQILLRTIGVVLFDKKAY